MTPRSSLVQCRSTRRRRASSTSRTSCTIGITTPASTRVRGNHQENNFGRGGRRRPAARRGTGLQRAATTPTRRRPQTGFAASADVRLLGSSDASPRDAPRRGGNRSPSGSRASARDRSSSRAPSFSPTTAQSTDPRDGCEPLDQRRRRQDRPRPPRSSCSFVQKVTNAQSAGGLGVSRGQRRDARPRPDVPLLQGGTSADVSISAALARTLADGTALEARRREWRSSVTMKRSLQIAISTVRSTPPSSRTNGATSSRTASSATVAVSPTNQAGGLGEGWGDFLGLLVMTRADDVESPAGANWAGAYPNGAYAHERWRR